MKFLLIALKLFYVLDSNLMHFPLASDEDTDEIKAQRKKWEEDELICRGHILNTLLDRLYNLYTSMKSPKEIWNALEAKYKTEKIGTNKFIIQKYFDYKMLDNVLVLDQVHELQILVNKLHDLSITESFQVGAIIVKLSPSWNNFRKKLMHMSEDLTLEKFGQHLQLEEESRVRDVTNTDSKVNVNNVQSGGSSKTNKHLKVNKSGSGFKKNNSKNPNKDKKNRACFHCGKQGYYIRECKLLKNKKKDEEGNVIEHIVAMVSGIHIDMITEIHITMIANPFDWLFDSGATMHVCNNKEQYKTYDESSIEQQVLMSNHNKAKVLVKGTVKVKMSSGKMIILTNVFHVPDIKKNLVSTNLLCKSDVKAVFESIFVEKGYATNGMFKLSIINKEVSSCAYIVDSSYLWHARLGHLNFKYLKFMSKYGMISYKHDDEKKCEICIQAKMTKKHFSKSDRNSIMLELVHSNVYELNGVLTRGSKRYFITFIKMNHLTCSNVIKLK